MKKDPILSVLVANKLQCNNLVRDYFHILKGYAICKCGITSLAKLFRAFFKDIWLDFKILQGLKLERKKNKKGLKFVSAAPKMFVFLQEKGRYRAKIKKNTF